MANLGICEWLPLASQKPRFNPHATILGAALFFCFQMSQQDQDLELVNADGYETMSENGSDDEFDESIIERVAALVDIVPPLARQQISSTVSTGFSYTLSLAKSIGSGLWVLATAALLVGLPAGLELERDAMAIQQEYQVKEGQ